MSDSVEVVNAPIPLYTLIPVPLHIAGVSEVFFLNAFTCCLQISDFPGLFISPIFHLSLTFDYFVYFFTIKSYFQIMLRNHAFGRLHRIAVRNRHVCSRSVVVLPLRWGLGVYWSFAAIFTVKVGRCSNWCWHKAAQLGRLVYTEDRLHQRLLWRSLSGSTFLATPGN